MHRSSPRAPPPATSPGYHRAPRPDLQRTGESTRSAPTPVCQVTQAGLRTPPRCHNVMATAVRAAAGPAPTTPTPGPSLGHPLGPPLDHTPHPIPGPSFQPLLERPDATAARTAAAHPVVPPNSERRAEPIAVRSTARPPPDLRRSTRAFPLPSYPPRKRSPPSPAPFPLHGLRVGNADGAKLVGSPRTPMSRGSPTHARRGASGARASSLHRATGSRPPRLRANGTHRPTGEDPVLPSRSGKASVLLAPYATPGTARCAATAPGSQRRCPSASSRSKAAS